MTADDILRARLHGVRTRRIADLLVAGLPCLALLVAMAWRLWGPAAATVLFAVGAVALAGLARLRARTIGTRWLARELDSRLVGMEDSADLLFAETAPLTRLERLQAARLRQRLEASAPPDLRPPWSRRSLVAAAVAAVAIPVVLLWPARAPTSFAAVLSSVGVAPAAPTRTRITHARLDVAPPGYTRAGARRQTTLDARAPEGSVLRWTLRFDPQPRAVALVFHDGRHLPLRPQGEDWRAQLVLGRSTLYRIELDAAPPLRESRLHRLDAIADRVPQVHVVAPRQGLSLVREGQRSWNVTFEARDDHGVAATAQLRIALAQGSGESITFREQTLPLQGRGSAARKRYTRTFDLGALGLAPGDDLVVQLDVHDNRAPTAQHARSPSLILRWPPADGEETGGLDGMANKVLPAYFRSQRQIIIDAEALLAGKRKLAGEAFLEQSDGIGADQRILRLRYGQFLGEESDGAPQLPTNDAESEAAPAQGHAEEVAEGQAAAQAPHADEHAPEGETAPAFGREPDITELYGHTHDQPEAATLLDPQTRTTLKAALDQMWQSELHLRQGDPAQALPYAYRALRHIKEAQQASRIYVGRVGTPELPPIDESRRLGGDRAGIARRGDALVAATVVDPALTLAWQALDAPPTPDRRQPAIDVAALERWLRANDARLDDPLALAAAIDALRKAPACMPCRRQLRAVLWPLLARPAAAAPRRPGADASGRRYLDALQQAGAP